jgi:hypothetical protein
MKVRELSREDVIALCKRVQYEDDLLNSRASVVLILNGLMAIAVAAAQSLPVEARIAGAIFMVAINVFWIPSALRARLYIKVLIKLIRQSPYIPIEDQVRFEALKMRRWNCPINFMCLWVPVLFIAGWLMGILLAVRYLCLQ